MRFVSFSAAVSLLLAASSALSQAYTPTEWHVGDVVDARVSDAWASCYIASPLTLGGYTAHCGSSDVRVAADQVRPHTVVVTQRPPVYSLTALELASQPPSLGSTYGTREPRVCNDRTSPLSEQHARDLFICDAEREFGEHLYLVSNVSLDIASSRPSSPNLDSGKVGIDLSQPVYDIRASYNNFQCARIASSFFDYSENRNCNEFKVANAQGGCYKNTAGEWHCVMYDFHSAAPATATSVKPPMGN